MNVDAEKYISSATASLIMERPFIGVLALTLNKIPNDKNCKTIASHADAMYYNSEYILSLAPHEVEFVIAHEVMHCALLHFARRQGRDKQRWNAACDFATNGLLINENMHPPEGILFNPMFNQMSAEDIYLQLDMDNESNNTLDDHQWDDNQTNNQSHQQQLEIQWKKRLSSALQQAIQANKASPAIRRLVDNLLEPDLPWHTLLAQYMTRYARDDYSYIPRPSNRREGDAIYPRLQSESINLIVAIDTSQSIDDKEIQQFISELNGLKSHLHARTTLLACDNTLHNQNPPIFEPWDTLQFKTSLKGGGGTDFNPVFNWIKKQDYYPDLLVYFTDGLGQFPTHRPHFPVLWLTKGKAKMPWGQQIQLN